MEQSKGNGGGGVLVITALGESQKLLAAPPSAQLTDPAFVGVSAPGLPYREGWPWD